MLAPLSNYWGGGGGGGGGGLAPLAPPLPTPIESRNHKAAKGDIILVLSCTKSLEYLLAQNSSCRINTSGQMTP